ncbi:Tartan [Daphnia magna]|uniref:Tartan n=1 Tax=Daphnia magna TaxID=35525 RepID=A0A164P0X3_9CRUS|nr:Tartan [Daphnia magna]
MGWIAIIVQHCRAIITSGLLYRIIITTIIISINKPNWPLRPETSTRITALERSNAFPSPSSNPIRFDFSFFFIF